MPLTSSMDPTCPTYHDDHSVEEECLSKHMDATTSTVTLVETRYIYPTTTLHTSTKRPSTKTMAKQFIWPTASRSTKPKRDETIEEAKTIFDKGHVLQALRILASIERQPLSLFTQKELPTTPIEEAPFTQNKLTTTTASASLTQKSTYLGPRATSHHSTHNAAALRYHHPSLIGRSAFTMNSFEFPPVPATLYIMLYISLALGSFWVVTVWLVNFPPRSWGKATNPKVQRGRKSNEKEMEDSRWWIRLVLSLKQRGRGWSKGARGKPFDKPSNYAAVPSASTSTSSEGSANSGASGATEVSQSISMHTSWNDIATTGATPTRTGHGAKEGVLSVRKRNSPRSPGQDEEEYELDELQRHTIPASPTLPPWTRDLPHLRRYGGKGADAQNQMTLRTNGIATAPSSPNIHVTTSPTSTPISPENPYLPTVSIQPRSSYEYRVAHTAFFKASTSPLLVLSSLSLASSSSSSSQLFYEDVDALEAQMGLPSHRRAKSEVHLSPNECGSYASGRTKKRWSRANVLEAVDGAVSWGVEKVIKWTDDAGDDELLLPLVGPKMEKME
jgi:hypothetical protein